MIQPPRRKFSGYQWRRPHRTFPAGSRRHIFRLYNFTDDIDTDQIKAAVAYQCPRFVKHVQNGTFDVVKTFYKDQPMLIFVLPAIVAEKEKRIIVGVSVNLKGEMIFNFNIED